MTLEQGQKPQVFNTAMRNRYGPRGVLGRHKL
jgi:hypothetical protein